ncbi:MAG: glycoside hydrolase family 3 C-terminal domain-containing protein, partial [Spirochaetaceae bacterium]|nr:glycoside hydrolase family 3 C-terminal domain-containing protein [Spirochaetaceae bacterium]
REEWGFDGLVMSDWGAVNDRPLGVQAGLDLEMPGPSPDNDKRIVKAVQEGKLSIEDLDKVVTRVVELILKGMHNKKHHYHYSRDAQHALARKAASESMVLLKNKGYSRKDKHGLLPINGKTTAVIGAFAKKPRYQGGGSSHINTIKVDNPFEELLKAGVAAEFAQGYLDEAPVKGIMGADKIPEGDADQALIAEAVKLARKKDIAIVFAGMPLSFESEGYDRRDMEMPKAHNALIEAVAAANPNTVVVLMCGSPVAMPWASKVKSILVAYLGGEAAGGAIADILSGKVNPSGKLSETWPVKLADNPSYGNFPGGHKAVYYKESIFTGYRFYDTAKLAPAYPFGHGLSYTSFEYSKLKLDKNIYRPSGFVRAQVTVKNTGKLYGAEVVELYVSAPRGSKVFRAKKELKGFEKIWLKPGEEKTIQFMLDTRSFAYYNTAVGGWAVEGGNYGIEVGSSSRDIRLKTKIEVEGGKRENLLKDVMQKADVYFDIKDAFKEGKGLQISDAAFKAIYGKALPKPDGEPDAPFTRSSSVEDVWSNPQARAALVGMLKKANSFYEIPDGPIPEKPPAGQEEAPLRAIALWSGGAISLDDVDELCAKLNMS